MVGLLMGEARRRVDSVDSKRLTEQQSHRDVRSRYSHGLVWLTSYEVLRPVEVLNFLASQILRCAVQDARTVILALCLDTLTTGWFIWIVA